MALQFTPPKTPNMLELLRGQQPQASAALPLPYPDAAPAEASAAPVAAAPPIAPQGQRLPSAAQPESAALTSRLHSMEAPPTTKDALLKAVLAFAPTAVAGAFSGLPAAAGAAQGVSAGLTAETAREDKQKASLIEQVQAARQREQQQGQFDTTLGQHRADQAQAGAQAAATLQNQRDMQNIDPLSPEGIAATAAARQKPNIDPNSPEGIAAAIAKRPPVVETPHTATTDQGVMQWNPITKQFDKKVGNRPPAQSATGEPLVQVLDDQGNLIWTPRSQAAGSKAPPTKQNPGDVPQSPYSKERAARTIQSVDELMGQVSGWNTGYGSLLSNIPESKARNFKAQLDTLKANIAFNELTAMREASKTGGALGAISEREMQLLTAALGALDTGQSPAELKNQLQKVKDSVTRFQEAAAVKTPTAGTGGWKIIGVK